MTLTTFRFRKLSPDIDLKCAYIHETNQICNNIATHGAVLLFRVNDTESAKYAAEMALCDLHRQEFTRTAPIEELKEVMQ